MKIALYSTCVFAPSFTNGHVPPPGSIEWTTHNDENAVACLATPECAGWMLGEQRGDPRPRILWLQEARWLTDDLDWFTNDFQLVLSNDAEIVAKGARYVSLFGTWITRNDVPGKTDMLSMIASRKKNTEASGYRMRQQIKSQVLGSEYEHGYGMLFFKKIAHKWDALAPYMFSIAVENEKYPWWHTEKLFDCFATKTVPLYWGCDDPSKLIEWGFDPSGIIWFNDVKDLRPKILNLSRDMYESMRPAIETNYRRAHELRCVEIALRKVIDDAKIFPSGHGL